MTPPKLRRNADGTLYKTPSGKLVVDHEHGPTELSATELIAFLKTAASLIKGGKSA